jgi:hypothetical protein
MEAFRFALQLALGIMLPLLFQRWDKRRLAPEERERAWNGVSWAAALFNFGEISIVAWFWVTRRLSPRALLGLPVSLAVFVFVHWGVDGAIGELADAKPGATLFATVALWGIVVLALVPIWGLALLLETSAARRARGRATAPAAGGAAVHGVAAGVEAARKARP